MPTIEEYGAPHRQSADVETIARLISTPSDEWLQAFGTNFEELDTSHETPRLAPAFVGKFIAIHDLVILAPFPKRLYHGHMLEAAKINNPKLIAEKQAAIRANGTGLPGKHLSGYDANKVSDGGYFTLKTNDDGVVTDIVLEKESGQFGRATEAGREQTAEYTQRTLENITASAFKQLSFEEFLAQRAARQQ